MDSKANFVQKNSLKFMLSLTGGGSWGGGGIYR